MSNASAIIRATTPTIVCTFPNYIDFSKAELIDVTIAQNAKTLTLHFPDVAAAGNTIEVYLQQHHSAKLNSGKAEIQINWTYPNGARASSSIEPIMIGRNLHPDVMPAPIYKGRVRRQDAANGQSETTYVSMDVMSNAVSVPMNVESSIVVSGEGGSGTQDVTVDSALSASSTNPVQNKVIKAALDTKYTLPQGGIPSTDLSAEVQTSLGLADSALQNHQDISGKADKVSNPTSGNFAALDANGNLVDSGHKHGDYLTEHQSLAGYLRTSSLEAKTSAMTQAVGFDSEHGTLWTTPGSGGGSSDGATVDSVLSSGSTNPVQNKVIAAALDAKYEKPVDGIPPEDLTAGIRAQLQTIGSAYQKPESGIPETDLATSVVEKLNRTASGDGASVGYVTPEMYGAIGDGMNDDAPALKAALESGKPVALIQDLYLKSNILLYDCNIRLEGNGYTIHFDGEALTHTSFASALAFRSSIRDNGDGKVRLVTDPEIIAPTPGSSARYQRGFLSYDGRHPIPGEDSYDNQIVKSWDEHTASVRNVSIRCRNSDHMAALHIEYMCHVVVDNVSAICEEGHDGAIGISVAHCYHVRITRCFSSGWTATNSAHLINLGYGFFTTGDNIIVSDCTGENCKHDFCAGASRDFFTTGLVVNNFISYRNFRNIQRSNNSAAYQQSFDIHAAAVHPVVNNLYLVTENHTTSPGTWHVVIRCQEATLTNIYAASPGGTGYIAFMEFAERITISNLFAPNSYVRLWDDNESVDMDRVEINGGRVRQIFRDESRKIERLIVRDMEITELVRRMTRAEFVNCTILRNIQWSSQPTVESSGSCVFRGCTIYGNRESNDDKSIGFVGLTAGVESAALRFYDCRFVCDSRKTIFRLPVWTSGCWAEDFNGDAFDCEELIPSWIDSTFTRHGYAADAKAVGDLSTDILARLEALEHANTPSIPTVMTLGTGRLDTATLG